MSFAKYETYEWIDYFQGDYYKLPKVRNHLHKSQQDFRHLLVHDRGYELADFHEEMVAALKDPTKPYLLLEVPREHGKSSIMELFIAHHLAFHPYAYVMVFSNTEDQSKKRSAAIKKFFERYEPYKALRQPTKYMWGAEAFQLQNGARAEFHGVGSSVAGSKYLDQRPTLVVLDDVVPETGRATITDKVVKQWFFETLLNLPDESAKIIIVGTPYRRTDLIYAIKNFQRLKIGGLDVEAFTVMHYEVFLGKDFNALFDDSTKTLWEKQWSLDRLRTKLALMGGNRLAFTRQYLCRTLEDKSLLYPSTAVDPRKDPDLVFYPHRPNKEEDGIEYRSIVAGVDIAISEREQADYFVVCIYGITKRGRMHLIWIERHHGINFLEQVGIILHLNKRYQFDAMGIESNGYQVVLAQVTDAFSGMRVQEFVTGSNKQDEIIGLQIVKAHLENNRIRYPCKEGQQFTQCTFDERINVDGDPVIVVYPTGGELLENNLEILFDEMSGWVREEEKWISTTEHDDTTLAQWFAISMAGKSEPVMKLLGDLSELSQQSSPFDLRDEIDPLYDIDTFVK